MTLASRPLHTPAMRDLTEAFDVAVEELDGWVGRVLRNDPVLNLLPRFDNRFTVIDDANEGSPMLPWTSRETAVRFARAFVVKHPEARLDSSFASSGEPTAVEAPLDASRPAGRCGEPASPDHLTPEQAFALAYNRLTELMRDDHSQSERVPLAPVIPIRKEARA